MVLSDALIPPGLTETAPFLVRFLKGKLIKLLGVSWRGLGSAARTAEDRENHKKKCCGEGLHPASHIFTLPAVVPLLYSLPRKAKSSGGPRNKSLPKWRLHGVLGRA
jgi:hypothetical protein